MNLAFVVTTLGRLEPLRALLDSLTGQLSPADRVVLVAQGNESDVAALAEEFAARDVPVLATTSGRGASLGRNTGVEALPEGDFVVTFPNDNTVYPAGTVSRLRAAVADPDFIAGGFTSWDERGPKTTLPAPGTPLDRYNVWAVIEMGILMRRSFFAALGGFDQSMGPGASTPWQVAEGTDLLLRALAARPALAQRFVWLPADVHVDGISTGFGLSDHERRRKLRAYGRDRCTDTRCGGGSPSPASASSTVCATLLPSRSRTAGRCSWGDSKVRSVARSVSGAWCRPRSDGGPRGRLGKCHPES